MQRSKVRLLDDQVINQIAAGEVIERPASVVKELVENSLDAGSTSIEISVVDGGTRLIAIQDDGSGMTRDDALLCLERHATSKIRAIHDIEDIHSLGFRGEALAAICAVSRVTLATRVESEPGGTRVVVNGGTIQEVEEAGVPAGTRIEVRNLFFNVPARRKFLRSSATELAHVRQVVLIHALGHPTIGFRFTSDDRLIYELPGGASREERVGALFSPELVRALLLVEYRDVEITVHGFVGTPQTSRADRAEQVIFINGRPARAPLISYALRESYQGTLPKGRHPVALLFLEVDPAQIDVNVHPAKKEVRFRRSQQVRDGLLRALQSALTKNTSEQFSPRMTPVGEAGTTLDFPPRAEPLMPIRDLPLLEPFPYPNRSTYPEGQGAEILPLGTSGKGEERDESVSPWAWCRILGQIGGLYVVMETDGGMVLMDPQAAHERVLYEGLIALTDTRAGISQGLLVPETVALPPLAAQRVRSGLEVLETMGFGLSEFGSDTFLVDALPSILGEVPAEPVLREIAEALETGNRSATARGQDQEAIARAACQAAVSVRKSLQIAEIERLVTDLARTEMPYTSPHGRPTLIFQSFRELDRKFGR